MNSITPMNIIVDNLVELTDLFSGVAMGDGLAPLLILIGALLVVFTMGVFGLLTLGAIGSLVTAN